MTQLIIAADAEAAARDGLLAGLSDAGRAAVGVATTIPTDSPKPPAFVRVVAAGGFGRDLVTGSHLLTVDAFAVRESEAVELAVLCEAILGRAARLGELGGVPCYAASGAIPVNLPHPNVPTHKRYTFTTSIELRKRVV